MRVIVTYHDLVRPGTIEPPTIVGRVYYDVDSVVHNPNGELLIHRRGAERHDSERVLAGLWLSADIIP